MKHPTQLIGAIASLMLAGGATGSEAPESTTNLGPAVVHARQTSIFGETPEERRRNQALAVAGVAGAVLLGVVLLDDDDDAPAPPPPPPPPPPPHH
ncbi:MAG: hypothetical protein WD081_08585 [Gammaproteobacteria bacterium]